MTGRTTTCPVPSLRIRDDRSYARPGHRHRVINEEVLVVPERRTNQFPSMDMDNVHPLVALTTCKWRRSQFLPPLTPHCPTRHFPCSCRRSRPTGPRRLRTKCNDLLFVPSGAMSAGVYTPGHIRREQLYFLHSSITTRLSVPSMDRVFSGNSLSPMAWTSLQFPCPGGCKSISKEGECSLSSSDLTLTTTYNLLEGRVRIVVEEGDPDVALLKIEELLVVIKLLSVLEFEFHRLRLIQQIDTDAVN